MPMPMPMRSRSRVLEVEPLSSRVVAYAPGTGIRSDIIRRMHCAPPAWEYGNTHQLSTSDIFIIILLLVVPACLNASAFTDTHMHARTNAHTRAHTYARTRAHAHTHACTHMGARVYARFFVHASRAFHFNGCVLGGEAGQGETYERVAREAVVCALVRASERTCMRSFIRVFVCRCLCAQYLPPPPPGFCCLTPVHSSHRTTHWAAPTTERVQRVRAVLRPDRLRQNPHCLRTTGFVYVCVCVRARVCVCVCVCVCV
jgi:hypothetical protein